jgi:hypothetical protein
VDYQKDTGEVIIFCDSSDFSTSDGVNWLKEDTNEAFAIVEGHRRHGKWSLCPAKANAIQYKSRKGSNWIFLCEILDTKIPNYFALFPSLRQITRLEVRDRGTIAQLHRSGKLKEGSRFDYRSNDAVSVVLSQTLLHEMFHAVFDDRS